MARTLLLLLLLAAVGLVALSMMGSPASHATTFSLSLASSSPASTHSAGRVAPDLASSQHSRSSVALGGVHQSCVVGVSLTCCGSRFGPVCG